MAAVQLGINKWWRERQPVEISDEINGPWRKRSKLVSAMLKYESARHRSGARGGAALSSNHLASGSRLKSQPLAKICEAAM